jgi:predicted acetyltransferase
MTSDIRVLHDGEWPEFAAIVRNAYPAFDAASNEEMVARLQQRQQDYPTSALVGLFRDGQLRGGMRLFDFEMRLFEQRVLMGGVGLVAVDMRHKKAGIARALIDYALRHYRERGASLVSLYPFRPDFYRQMGFGYGSPMYRYTIKPAALPRQGDRSRVQFLPHSDWPAVHACYERCFARMHGLYARSADWFRRWLAETLANPRNRLIGYRQGESLTAYLTFAFQPGKTFLQNSILVHEMLAEHSVALNGLLSFLHFQYDQIQEIVLDTQEEYFYLCLHDVRDGSNDLIPPVYHPSHRAGIGLMYRLVNTAGFFATLDDHRFGPVDYTLAIDLRDDFLTEQAGTTVVRFRDGRPQVLATGSSADVRIVLDGADFAALALGSIEFGALQRLGLAAISDESCSFLVQNTFRVERRPICLTRF